MSCSSRETRVPMEKSHVPVIPAPCEGCSGSCCSNCLVPFKFGEKMVTRIPSKELGIDKQGQGKCVPAEAAFICVFAKSSPFAQWIAAMELSAFLPAHLIKVLDGKAGLKGGETAGNEEEKVEKAKASAPQDDDKKAERKIELESAFGAVFEEMHEVLKVLAAGHSAYLDLIKKKVQDVKALKKEDGSLVNELRNFVLEKLEEYRVEGEEEMKELGLEIMATKINKVMKIKTVGQLPNFQLCVGCAEILAVLYVAMENLHAKRLTEESYYHAVILGFKNAKFARDVILRPPECSKMHVFHKYGRECHPVGCKVRTTLYGTKFSVASSKQDSIKNAVGNLHAYLEEGYHRIFNEIVMFDKVNAKANAQ